MFTVLIPAFNRPELLRNALMSVSQQTAKHAISSVIVSENGLNKASKEVCAEFHDLDIKYFFHEKQKPVLEHLKWVLSQVNDGYGAMLCDDDWWDIHHLELAEKHLKQNDDCVAYFSNHAFSFARSAMKNNYSDWNRSLHFGRKDFLNYKPTIYSSKDVFVQCFLITPFHFSAMICKGDILKKSVNIFDSVHPTYADRILFPVISTYGNVLYNPLVTAIILFHPGMDGNTYASKEWKLERQIGSSKILDIAKVNDIDIAKEINLIYSNQVLDDNEFIFNNLKDIFYERQKITWFNDVESIINLDLKEKLLAEQANSVKRKIKNTVKNIIHSIGSKI